MEVSLIKETDGNTKGSDTVSKSSHSQMLVPGELHLANNEQETYKCDHFTIRGYVAEVREREMKNCWPLFTHDNHALEGQPDLVPPLSVKKFRRWNCQNCLHKTIGPENVVENGMLTNVQNYDEVQKDCRLLNANATTPSHHSPKKYIASLPQQCKEKSLEERTVEKDSFIHGSNGQRRSLLCLGQKDTKLQSSGSVKEGTTISKGGQDRSYEDQKQTSKETVVAAEGEACQTGAGNTVVRSNISESTLLDKDTTSIMVSKRKDTELIHGIGDVSGKTLTSMGFKADISDKTDDQGILKRKVSSRNGVKFLMPRGVDVTVRKRGAFPDVTGQPSRHDLEALDRGGPEDTDTNQNLVDTMVHSQDVAKKQTGSVDVQQHKRGPKVRSINEIIRHGELRRTENVGVSNGDAETNNNHIGRKVSITSRDRASSCKYSDRSAGSNFEDENPAHRIHLVTQNDERNFTRKKDVLTNDDGLLAHWLKQVSTKPQKRKRNAESKHTNTKVGKCKSVALKDLDLNVEYRGEKDEEGIIGEEKQSMMADVIPSRSMLKEDELPGRGHTIFENLPTNDSHSKNAHSKFSEVGIFNKDVNHGLKAQENCGKIALLSNKKNKRPRVEDGASSQTHWPKRRTGFKLYSEMERKRTSEQKAEDGITLLAKQQHGKNLMNGMSDNGSMCNSFVMTESMKNGNMRGIGGAYGSMVSDEMCWSISPKEPQSSITEYNHWTAIRNDGVVECGRKNFHSSRVSKPTQYIDLNQEAPISACTDSQAFSPSTGLSASEDQFSFIDPRRTCSQLNNSWNGMDVLALCSDHINRTASGNRPIFAHNGSSVLLNKTPVTNFRKLDVGFNSNDISSFRVIPKPVARDAGYQMMVDLSGKSLLSCQGKPASSVDEGRTLATKTFAVAVNQHHPEKMDQGDLNANETISALNLLRLMDQAACSGEPHQSSIHNDYIRSTHQSNGQGNELLRSEVGVRSSEVSKITRIVETPSHDQQARNPGKPIRPVARFGILGPHLQKEIASSSNNNRLSLGFQSRYSDVHSFRQTNALGKGEAFQPATVKTMSPHTAISKDVTPERIDYPGGSLVNPGCSIGSDDRVQLVNNNKNGTFQPVRNTYKMEECVVNRNPAEFATPDDFDECMIEYKEPRTKRKPQSRNLQSPSHRSGKKCRK